MIWETVSANVGKRGSFVFRDSLCYN